MRRIVLWMMIAALCAAFGCRKEAARDPAALETDAAIAYVQWCGDMTDERKRQEYEALAARADRLRSADKPELCRLLSRERALVDRYFMLPLTLTVERDGRAWTGDAILNDPSLSEETFAALYEAYSARFGAEAGKVYLELIEVRKAIADAYGFDSFAAYAAAYSRRSCSFADTAKLEACVAAEIAPLLPAAQADFSLAAGRLYGLTFAPEPTMQAVGEAIASLLPELGRIWNEMLERGLCDVGTGEKRMPLSFARYLPAYGVPVLFLDWTGAFDMPSVLTNAFGTFASQSLHGDDGIPSDLAQIDAQGLELLTVLRYDTIYGDLSDDAETAELFFALYMLLDGCAKETFERFAYAQEQPTAEDLNAAYERIAADYGLTAFGGGAYSWTRDPYLFQSPFSGADRAVGMLAALELFLLGTEDENGAVSAYRTVLNRSDAATLQTVLRAAGLCDPFSGDAVRRIAQRIGAYRNGKRE